MALVPCQRCRQPFYALCHDGVCTGGACPWCEYTAYGAESPADRNRVETAHSGDGDRDGDRDEVDMVKPFSHRCRIDMAAASVVW